MIKLSWHLLMFWIWKRHVIRCFEESFQLISENLKIFLEFWKLVLMIKVSNQTSISFNSTVTVTVFVSFLMFSFTHKSINWMSIEKNYFLAIDISMSAKVQARSHTYKFEPLLSLNLIIVNLNIIFYWSHWCVCINNNNFSNNVATILYFLVQQHLDPVQSSIYFSIREFSMWNY